MFCGAGLTFREERAKIFSNFSPWFNPALMFCLVFRNCGNTRLDYTGGPCFSFNRDRFELIFYWTGQVIAKYLHIRNVQFIYEGITAIFVKRRTIFSMKFVGASFASFFSTDFSAHLVARLPFNVAFEEHTYLPSSLFGPVSSFSLPSIDVHLLFLTSFKCC